MRNILGSGAEATVYLDIDSKSKNSIVDKERSKKNYRHEDIDSVLRRTRTKKESKILKALEKFDIAPKLIEQRNNQKATEQGNDKKDNHIIMEYIDGIQLKKLLDKNPRLAGLIGKNLTIMHGLNIIHGDLTTSNMILVSNKSRNVKSQNANKKLYFIDFGLSFNSSKVEDKAVDIHLFKQALESKHYKVCDKAYKEFLMSYNPKNKREILERLAIVEQRGRYKEKT